MFKKTLATCLTSASLLLVANTVFADTYATALLDITGSMQSIRTADGLSRCEYGKQLFLKTVAAGINRSDYLNLGTFDVPGSLASISNGFVNVKGLSSSVGTGKQLYDSIADQVENMPCDGSSTALGEALCDSMDNLRSSSTGNNFRLAVVTDAGENSSTHCGGTDYEFKSIYPKMSLYPKIIFDLTVLVPPGNVGAVRAYQNSEDEVLEEDAPTTARSGTRSVTEEVERLILISKLSGGEAAIVTDAEICISGCAPMDGMPAVVGDDPWGGAW